MFYPVEPNEILDSMCLDYEQTKDGWKEKRVYYKNGKEEIESNHFKVVNDTVYYYFEKWDEIWPYFSLNKNDTIRNYPHFPNGRNYDLNFGFDSNVIGNKDKFVLEVVLGGVHRNKRFYTYDNQFKLKELSFDYFYRGECTMKSYR